MLRLPDLNDSERLREFEERNRAHLSPWGSTTGQIERWMEEFEAKRSIRFLVFLKDHPEGEIIGFCNFTQIFRGPFQACYLGYHIDAAHEGKGLMSEAVTRGIRYMFEEEKLHRIMANYMPSNTRSAQLLCKLGFKIEGLAEQYLLINGQWEDHVLTSLIHPDWQPAAVLSV